MKKYLRACFLLTGLGIGLAHGQTVRDTVSTGPGYSQQVFYSLENGTVKTAPRNSWDIAFQANLFGAAIRANHVAGVRVFDPGLEPADWESPMDTTNLDNWTEYHDADTSWEVGAFDRGGWLSYGGSGLIVGAKIFAVRGRDGQLRKFLVNGITNSGGTPAFAIVFRYARPDGSQEVVDTIIKTQHAGRNFIHYSFSESAVVDQEPASRNDWDLLFTQYTADLNGTPYNVAGVLHNFVAATPFGAGNSPTNVRVATATDVDVSTATDEGLTYERRISAIGYDWKTFNLSSFSWSVQDSLAFFVRTMNNKTYRLVFTGFGGSANGNHIFDKTELFTTSLDEGTATPSLSLALYPNPTTGGTVQVAYSTVAPSAQLTVRDLTGRTIQTHLLSGATDLAVHHLTTHTLPAGVYLISLQTERGATTQRLVVR